MKATKDIPPIIENGITKTVKLLFKRKGKTKSTFAYFNRKENTWVESSTNFLIHPDEVISWQPIKEKTALDTSDKPIHQVDLALRLAGFAFKKQHVELIMRILNETDGNTKLDEIVRIRHEVEQKYEDIETAKAMDFE